MGLDQVVNINITRESTGVTQVGFGTALALGPNGFPGEIRSYFDMVGVGEDYEESDPEYIIASKLFGQNPRPELIKFGKTSTPVAQVVTFTPNVAVQAIHEYTVTLNGVTYTFVSDASPTAAEVVTGLIALINADSGAKQTASGTTTLIVTADNVGESFAYDSDVKLPGVLTVANVGIASDIFASIDIDSDWYFLLTTAKDDVTVKEAAKTIETMKRQYFFRNDDDDVRAAPTTDLISDLKALGYLRTAPLYGDDPSLYGEAGWVGRVAPLSPGSETWANKTISGLVADKWTANEQTHLKAKNANYYVKIAGVDVTQLGITVGGEYVDVIRFIDWLAARMQEKIFGDIAKLDKIPFTDPGISIIDLDMRAVLEAGVTAGGIASSQDYSTTVPLAKNISSQDKQARKLRGCKFKALLAGAIHAVEINGTVTI